MIVKKITLLKYLFLVWLGLSNNFVYAFGTVSRSCPVQDIPVGLKTAALLFFEIIGNAPFGSLTKIADLGYFEQQKYFVNESLRKV